MAARGARPKLLVIVGPTASGKSELAMRIARQYDGEIIAADSRTIYKGMDIGTAKPNPADQAQIRHHLIDIIHPGQSFSAGEFKKLAAVAIDDIHHRGKLPILVGGTGLYVDTVMFDYQFNQGAERDPVNPRHKRQRGIDTQKSPIPGSLIVGLMPDKLELGARIMARADAMVREGLIDEVKALAEQYPSDLEVFKTPGYQPFFRYLAGEIDLQTARDQFIQGDLQLAKKQRTWFKRNRHIKWFDNVSDGHRYISAKLAANK